MILVWQLPLWRIPQCIRPDRKSFILTRNSIIISTKQSNLLEAGTINFLWKVQWFSTYSSKCLYLTQKICVHPTDYNYCFLFILHVLSTHWNGVINMRVLLEWYNVLTTLANCSYCSNAIRQIIFTSLIIVIVKKCQKQHFNER